MAEKLQVTFEVKSRYRASFDVSNRAGLLKACDRFDGNWLYEGDWFTGTADEYDALVEAGNRPEPAAGQIREHLLAILNDYAVSYPLCDALTDLVSDNTWLESSDEIDCDAVIRTESQESAA